MSFIPFNEYNKRQVILTSDRLIFNSQDDNIFLLAKKDVCLSGNQLHFNATDDIIFSGKRVRLGIGNDVQPVPKGDNLTTTLESIVSILNDIGASLSTATATGVGVSSLPTLNTLGKTLIDKTKRVSEQIKKVNSTTTYTS